MKHPNQIFDKPPPPQQLHCTRVDCATVRKTVAIFREALWKLTKGWLYRPAKRQPDPRVTLYESKTLAEIEEMAMEAIYSEP